MTKPDDDRKTAKRRAPLTDFATYRRLLGYLRGEGLIVAAVFACIAFESLFTVMTISSLKPILDLMGDEPILAGVTASAGRQLDFEPWIKASDGARTLTASGEAVSAKSAERIRRRVTAAADGRDTHPLTLDMSAVRRIHTGSWFALAEGAAAARKSGTPLRILLNPAAGHPPITVAPLMADLSIEAAGTTTSGATVGGVADATGSRTFDGMKQWVIDRLGPRVEALQSYAEKGPSEKFRTLALLVALMLASAACMVGAGFGTGYLSNLLATRVVQKLRDHLFGHMVGLDLAHFTSHSTGSQMSVVIQDVQAVDGAIDILFSSVFKTPVTVVVLVAAMWMVSPRLTLFCFTVLPLIGAIIFLLGRRVRRVSGRIQQAKGILAAVLEETFGGIRVVKAYGAEARERARFAVENRRIFKLSLKTAAAQEIGGGATQLLGVATIGAMVLAGGHLVVVSRELTYSNFIVFVGLLSQVFRPLKGVSRTNAKLQRGLAGCDRVFATLDTRAAIADRPDATAPGPLRGALELRGVRFRYSPDRAWALDGIDLTIAAGKSVALVGSAGCGKSTLANLVPRFYDPTEGAVLWDGTDLRDLTVAGLRSHVALITQDVILFDDTAAANIAYGAPADTPMERIEAAARAARADGFLRAAPDGYATRLGGRGVRLSGGERQRLAIARAILKDASVLILDEATSALDSENEALVQAALAELMKGRTTLVIAHRLSTIKNCDEICVMDAGRIVERGTHATLLAAGGRYARFHAIQAEGMIPT